MELTETGQSVFEYADEIFSLGNELVRSVQSGGISRKGQRIAIGITESMHKLIAREIIKPILDHEQPPRIVCREGSLEQLLLDLASYRLDLVISDEPAPAASSVKVFNHSLGNTGVAFLGVGELAARYRDSFPQSLNEAPLLVPTERNALRRLLDQWFHKLGILPRIVGEFEDTALSKFFAADGAGIIAVPQVVSEATAKQFNLESIGVSEDCQESFYVISPERKLKHPAVIELTTHARDDLFEQTQSLSLEATPNGLG